MRVRKSTVHATFFCVFTGPSSKMGAHYSVFAGNVLLIGGKTANAMICISPDYVSKDRYSALLVRTTCFSASFGHSSRDEM